MERLQDKYNLYCRKKSDINEHLPTLFKYALECNTILETGVRAIISSYALVYGLVSNNLSGKKKLLLNDIKKCDTRRFHSITRKLDIDIEFQWINNLDLELKHNYDLIFIDTWHVYGQLKRELAKFSKYANKYIIMHDTTVDEIYGESIRRKRDAKKQSLESGFSVEEIQKGLGPAITEFLASTDEWVLKEKFTNNNGLTVLERVK